ncbi:MAG: thiamine phosphate synthase [Chloroflexota bacterium]
MASPAPSRYQLHLVTEPRRDFAALKADIAEALNGGADCVQLRDKGGSAAALFAQATELLALAQQTRGLVVLNDRVDVALAAGAHGVHLAAQSLPVCAAVQLTSGHLMVGRSVHSLGEAREAAREGADYVTFGHVFPTTSHPGLAPRGLEQLQTIVQAIAIPVLAIGGITTTNLDAVLATGCAGIAVISAILGQPEPRTAARRLRDALDNSPRSPRVAFAGGPQARLTHASAGIPA